MCFKLFFVVPHPSEVAVAGLHWHVQALLVSLSKVQWHLVKSPVVERCGTFPHLLTPVIKTASYTRRQVRDVSASVLVVSLDAGTPWCSEVSVWWCRAELQCS